MIKLSLSISAVLLLLVVLGCGKESRDPCLQPRQTLMRAHAYRHADTGSAILDTLLPAPVLIPLSGQAVQYYYLATPRSARLSFTLSGVADSSRWVVRPDTASALQDTFTVFYDRQLRFLSNACGYTYFFNLKQIAYTRHALDSAVIARGDVTADANVEHLKLYY
jgi:hypothetical protein